MNRESVADIVEVWTDPEFSSGLIDRCKQHWHTPINVLPDIMVATYLNQEIAVEQMAEGAHKRIGRKAFDGSELYEGQLAEALKTSRRI